MRLVIKAKVKNKNPNSITSRFITRLSEQLIVGIDNRKCSEAESKV